MKTEVLTFCTYSNTIRQLPQNYLIASFDENKNYWICDPDSAANKDLATRVFLELFNFESKYNKNGLNLLLKVTPNCEFKQTFKFSFVGRKVGSIGKTYKINAEYLAQNKEEAFKLLYTDYEHISTLCLNGELLAHKQ